MKRCRIFIFRDRPDFLLVYVPEGGTFVSDVLSPPFTRETVTKAMAMKNVPNLQFTITETMAGRWRPAMVQAQKAELAERGQRQREDEARQAQLMRTSNDRVERDRAAIILHKQEVDARIRELKQAIGEAKARAYKNREYMPRVEFEKLETGLRLAQDESIQLQATLRALREEQKARNIAEAKKDTETFERVARRLLPSNLVTEIEQRMAALENTDALENTES